MSNIKNETICENCNKSFTSLQRKKNHFKMCNYENLEKEITNLKFDNFLLKSLNHNNKKMYEYLHNIYQNDIECYYNLMEKIENNDDNDDNENIEVIEEVIVEQSLVN